MEPGRYRLDDFELYRIARDYRKKLYQVVGKLPPVEKYCLAPQMRRAAAVGIFKTTPAFAESPEAPWTRCSMISTFA
jgi:hypothetical protein